MLCLHNWSCDMYLCDKIFILAVRYNLTTSSFVWLGASDEEVEGSFVWLPSGDPLNFENWDSEVPQPNDPSSDENCLAYYHGTKGWHDAPCSSAWKVFICEGWWHMAVVLIVAWYLMSLSLSRVICLRHWNARTQDIHLNGAWDRYIEYDINWWYTWYVKRLEDYSTPSGSCVVWSTICLIYIHISDVNEIKI